MIDSAWSDESGASSAGAAEFNVIVAVLVLFWADDWSSVVSLRQCAIVALRDVKSYLSEEGGQIAVSSALQDTFIFGLHTYWN